MRTTVSLRASCLLALCAVLLLPACGGDDGGQLKKPNFPFGGFRLTNHDVDKKDVKADLDVGGSSYPLKESPIKVDMAGVAPDAVVLSVASVTLSMTVGDDASAHPKEWKAADYEGVYLKGITLVYDGKAGGPYHVTGKVVVYIDAADPTKTKIANVDTTF